MELKAIDRIAAKIRAGAEISAGDLDTIDVTDALACEEVRFAILRPLVDRGEDRLAAAILDRMVQGPHATQADRVLLARLVWEFDPDRARSTFDDLMKDHRGDPRGLSMVLTRLMMAGEVDAAADYAENYADWPADARLTGLALKALTRAGREDTAMAMLEARDAGAGEEQLEQRLQMLNARGEFDKAIAIAPATTDDTITSPAIHIEVGDAMLGRQRSVEAVEHYTRALELEPGNLRALLRRGEILLTKGDHQNARADLEQALEQAPHLPHLRVWLARALKATGEYDRAAELMTEACLADPENETLRRAAASALNQAGQQEAAIRLYDHLIDARRRRLPNDFESGLDALWDRLEDANIPKARFDWAWRFRDPEVWPDSRRAEWEDRGRWGLLADRLIYDWLECRMDQAEQLVERVAELDPLEAMVRPLVEQGRGLVFASAHIGAMFSGPLALELLGLENRWLASTPGLPTVDFARQLISTSDQTEAQVARQAMRVLGQGCTLTIAIDGAMNVAAPRIPFEGQEITYSSFAARLAYKQRAPSIFAVPQWHGKTIEFHLTIMPYPEEGETMEQYTARWREAYLEQLRIAISGAPENLRLAGGIWRHIQPG
ncbi:tetratricopeptide repeat protein [Alteraurantiacibacter aquimixticola]|uniref:Tetratricopeptide repeat protein n=1 Tax=Alteraurantiacibacter aquimixticola TaxID=2489173 RepID=A0A4V4U969_9SPHN|nr:tetratricopeptide repeat protein [Alteraurantiacibacter aquimixticola]TIX50703.1 tetratricopeptide repeat protein [Alteraurantiacibacter aquimixticola]